MPNLYLFQGQSIIDVAQDDIVSMLEELKKNNKRTKRRPASQNRISDNNIINNAEYHSAETPAKVIRNEVKNDEKKLGKYHHRHHRHCLSVLNVNYSLLLPPYTHVHTH